MNGIVNNNIFSGALLNQFVLCDPVTVCVLCVGPTATVEQVTILETVDERTAINLQVHKRVWPAAQRDSLFWSHIERQVVDGQEYWVVVNNSTDYASEVSPGTPSCA